MPGDEVVVPSMTFASTANVVIACRRHAGLADVKRDTMCLNADDLASRITPRTRAVIPVHFAGRACDMDDISERGAASSDSRHRRLRACGRNPYITVTTSALSATSAPSASTPQRTSSPAKAGC